MTRPSIIYIEYRDLCITTQALVGDAAQPTVGQSFINLGRSLLFLKPGTREMHVLQKASGVLEPGRLTLLLGPPGAGKTRSVSLGEES